MNNLKDKATNICKIILVLCGVIYSIKEAGIVMPHWVDSTLVIAGILAGAVVAHFTGKNPNGKKKTTGQVIDANYDLKK